MKAQMIHLVSMTEAYRAKKALTGSVSQIRIIPTPTSINKRGCGYSLVFQGDLEEARRILKKSNIPIRDYESKNF